MGIQPSYSATFRRCTGGCSATSTDRPADLSACRHHRLHILVAGPEVDDAGPQCGVAIAQPRIGDDRDTAPLELVHHVDLEVVEPVFGNARRHDAPADDG